MNNTSARFILLNDQTLQFRPARDISNVFADAVARVCKANPSIIACYLFDIRQKQSDPIGLAIALRLESETTQMDQMAAKFQRMLQEFPDVAKRTIILSAKPFESVQDGSEFYARQSQ